MIQSKPRGNTVASPAQASNKGRKLANSKRGATGDQEAELNNSSDNNLDDPGKNQGIAAGFEEFEQDSNYKAEKGPSSPTASYDKKVQKVNMGMSRHTTKHIDSSVDKHKQSGGVDSGKVSKS